MCRWQKTYRATSTASAYIPGQLALLAVLVGSQLVAIGGCSTGALDLTSKRGSVGQSEGLLIPRSSVRFRLKPRNSNSNGFELHKPSIKGTKLLLKVIKTIIIIICHALARGRRAYAECCSGRRALNAGVEEGCIVRRAVIPASFCRFLSLLRLRYIIRIMCHGEWYWDCMPQQ